MIVTVTRIVKMPAFLRRSLIFFTGALYLVMEKKRYLTAQELLNDSFELGLSIFKSGFKPSFIIAVWRGGTPVGIAVQEMLDHLGVKTDHISIRTSSYYGIKKGPRPWVGVRHPAGQLGRRAAHRG